MDGNDSYDIKGLDAYPKLKMRRKFPAKKHMLVECPRHGEIVGVVFSRKGRPICLNSIGKDECDFCWAFNLHLRKNISESLKQQILEEINYWESVRNTKIGRRG